MKGCGWAEGEGTDLFKHCRNLTPMEVAESDRWCVAFSHKDTCFQKDLTLLLHHFHENVSADLCHQVMSDMKAFDEMAPGGLLFLESRLDKCTKSQRKESHCQEQQSHHQWEQWECDCNLELWNCRSGRWWVSRGLASGLIAGDNKTCWTTLIFLIF